MNSAEIVAEAIMELATLRERVAQHAKRIAQLEEEVKFLRQQVRTSWPIGPITPIPSPGDRARDEWLPGVWCTGSERVCLWSS